MYASMKPQSAARIFNTLDIETAASLLREMKPFLGFRHRFADGGGKGQGRYGRNHRQQHLTAAGNGFEQSDNRHFKANQPAYGSLYAGFCLFVPGSGKPLLVETAAAIEPVATAQIKPIETRSSAKVSGTSEMVAPQMTEDGGQSISLSFPWNIPVGLAVFRRGDYLWIIFDHSQNINVDELAASAAPLVDELIQIPNYQALILRLKPKEGTYYTVRKEGLLWVVDLLKKPFPDEEHRYLQAFTQYDSRKQPYLFRPRIQHRKHRFHARPEIGDTLIAAPVWTSASVWSTPILTRISTSWIPIRVSSSYPKPTTLSSAAPRPASSIQGYNRGLNISHNLEILKRQAMLSQDDSELSPLTGASNAALMNKSFVEAEEQLRGDTPPRPKKKNKARLELAKYYVMRASAPMR